jgi:hypothetical protein
VQQQGDALWRARGQGQVEGLQGRVASRQQPFLDARRQRAQQAFAGEATRWRGGKQRLQWPLRSQAGGR